MRKGRRNFSYEEEDPSSLLSNLFDVAMVFAVALMVALVTKFNMTEVFSKEDYTIVKNPGKDNMDILVKKGEKIERYQAKGNGWVLPTSLKMAKSYTSRKSRANAFCKTQSASGSLADFLFQTARMGRQKN